MFTMKVRRRSFAICSIILATGSVAQTNSFPSSGNVGIGTSTPSAKLEIQAAVNGSRLMVTGEGGNSYNTINNFASDGVTLTGLNMRASNYSFWGNSGKSIMFAGDGMYCRWLQAAGSNSLVLGGAYGEHMTIMPSGNVGVGTSTPAARFHVNGAIRVGNNANEMGVDLTYNDDGWATVSEDSARWGLVRRWRIGSPDGMKTAMQLWGTGYSAPQSPALSLYESGANTEVVRIASNGVSFLAGGNVGIGTTNPAGKLTMRGVGGSASSNGIEWQTGGNVSGYGGWSGRIYTGVPSGSWATAPFIFAVPDGSGGEINTMTLLAGNVGIGVVRPSSKLEVNGAIRAKEVIVETSGWADYVLSPDYRLAPLSEIEAHIRTMGTLPGIPSAAEVADKGVSVGDMQAKLLGKIEELVLHMIALEKENRALKDRIEKLETN